MARKVPHTVNDNGTITIGESSSFTRKIVMLNPTEKSYYDGRSFVLWFGAYGCTRLHVYARHLDDALDECIDWIVENAPGLLCDEAVEEAYREAKAEGKNDEEAWEEAEEDTTSGGNCGNRILSYEWGIALENPDGKTLRAYAAGDL